MVNLNVSGILETMAWTSINFRHKGSNAKKEGMTYLN